MWSTIEKGVQIKRNSLCYRVAVTQCPSCNWMIARIHLDGTCNELQRDVGTALNLSVTINRERAFLCFCIFVFCVIFKKCVGSTIAPDGYTDCHIKKADSNGLWEWLFILFVPAELWCVRIPNTAGRILCDRTNDHIMCVFECEAEWCI